MKTLLKTITLSLLFIINSINVYAQSWQYAKTEGGNRTTLNNDNIDDEVLKIIPAIENDGSYIVVSKLMQTGFDDYDTYFDSTVVIKQNFVLSKENSTIIIAKHDCDGNAVIVRQIEDVPFYDNNSIEGFRDIVQINNKYYLFAHTTHDTNDTTILLDRIITEPLGAMFIVLNENLEIDTFRNSNNPSNRIAPFNNMVRVGEDKNLYFITGSYTDSATFYDGEVALLHKGLSLVKMDTFGHVLNVHRLTDTVSIFGGGYESFVRGMYLDIAGNIYLSGEVNLNGLLFNNTPMVTVYNSGNSFIIKLDSNFNTIWLKQTIQLSTSGFGISSNFSLNHKGVALLSTFPFNPNYSFVTGVSFDGDTVITNNGAGNIAFPVKIDPNTGNKLSWDYPDAYTSINNVILEDSILYLNYEYTNMFWQNINIPTQPLDWFSNSPLQHNGIFKYNLNTGVVDTVTTYSFTHNQYGNPPISNSITSSMIKIGDNFIVGGNVGVHAYIGGDTISDAGGPGSSLFFAKFGTSQCTFCDSAVANFTYTIDTFNVSFSNNSLFTDSYTWLIDDSIVVLSALNNYNFIDTGMHTICLIAENSCSVDTFCKNIHITCAKAQSLFTLQQEDLSVSISNNSLLANSLSINWGDGTINTSIEHTYLTPGSYQICLAAINFCGIDTACISVEIIADGLAQYSNGFVVKMYPNPAKDEIQIEWQNIENKHKSIKIYNLFGQEVSSERIENNAHKSQKMSLKNYTKGIYFVVLEVEGQLVWREKLVVE